MSGVGIHGASSQAPLDVLAPFSSRQAIRMKKVKTLLLDEEVDPLIVEKDIHLVNYR